MKEAKILLTINLEGVLSNQTEGHILPYVKHDEQGKKVIKTGTFLYKQRIPSVCARKQKLSEEAYKFFISNAEIPAWYKPKRNNGKLWEELTDNEKITFHCARIAEGNSFSFVVLNN